jgi:predicted Fe-S protein YdhL (DUF1289 family)
MDWTGKQASLSQEERHSPCIGVCKLDEETGLCIGCARSADEIAQWPSLNAGARLEIWNLLNERHSWQAKRARLLPLTPAEILRWAANTIENRIGTWVTGMPGALAEFVTAADQTAHIELEPGQLTARTDTAAFRLKLHDRARAFTFEKDGPIVLGLPKGRITQHSDTVFKKLGADADAIDPDCRSHLLFDYGLGRKYSRFGIRTNNETLTSILSNFEGKSWEALMAAAGSQILMESPHRVVESSLARIEVYAPIPAQNGHSPEGAHTHFLPAFLASGGEISLSLALPDYAAPMAIFYPL